ncbi:kelch repeats protein-like protein [Cucurbitaria berberidis CBS 394.84]|uniref:Kelch repeats protein-like protein n=1 Tax=Cucurbitaria berberidis CBS 394.84 TaxID=1168544 RepID=A0A9P4GEG2_9PLEO|nr:kelch repeats protein-like protein [Cucurbitaria berberidis CBS 394.84]KAF1843715.1 kelch repeats protein-like protein [Cucurbitaria berberidis CBS 394.84]
MAKDKKKAVAGGKAAVKAAKAAKQEKKAGKKDKKVASKTQEIDSDAEEVDLDAVLAQYAKEQEQYHAITEVASEPPSARTSGTIIASPATENELFLFGGEYFNGATAKFFNDLLIYNIKQDSWKKVTSPNSPLPRSGHAWCRAANTKDIYLFGGEFSSPKQGTFYHYNDFWRLDPMNREWTRVEGKSKTAAPPARSGHRMVSFKQYIILFGGFQDTSATTKYLNDLWIYDCINFAWHTPKLQAARAVPDARSSFTLLPHEQGAVIYGGYSRVKAVAGGKQQQQQKGKKGGGGGGPASRMVLKPKVHDDTWFLRITPPPADQPSTTLPTVSWEKRKKPANAPNPPRAGATMAYHKGRGVLFGGVHDVEESEEGIDSEFFNQLFVWNVERNRYMPLTLRRPKTNANKKAAQQANINRRDRGKAAEEELLANLKALEMKAGVQTAADSDDEAEKAKEEEEEEEARPEKPRIFEYPHPRFNAALTVQADTLYIYGGTFEKGDREFTFDELWSVNLNHLDGVTEIFKRELEDWQGSEDEADSDDEDDEDDSEEDEDEDEKSTPTSTAPTSVTDSPLVVPSKATPEDDLGNQEEISALTDTLPHPRPFESLREFYARTSEQWQNIILDELTQGSKISPRSPKEIKKMAFERAEEKWWDCREEIRALEDEQEAAGIGEVVSLADKEGAGGVGRRR